MAKIIRKKNCSKTHYITNRNMTNHIAIQKQVYTKNASLTMS